MRLALGRAPLCIHILVCVSQHRWQNAIGQKKAPSQLLAITRGIHRMGTERRSSGQAYLFNIWKIGANRSLSSTSGQDELVAPVIL
jgi:hypothetical protein